MQNYESGDCSYLQDKERRRQDRSDDVTLHKNLHDSFNESDESHDRYEQAQMDKDTKYRNDLKQQCQDNAEMRHQIRVESSAMQQVRQEIGAVMADQNQRYIEHQQEQSDQLRQDIISFKQDCADFKDMQRELINIEERRIDGQRHETSDRSDAVIAERERKIQEKDDYDDKLASEYYADEDERQDREHDLDVKHEREYLEKHLRDDQRKKDEHDEEQRDLRDCLLLQMEENKQHVRDEKKRDMVFSDAANVLMAHNDELEKERARKKKEVNDQYYEDLRQQIEDNAVRRKREKEEDRM
ncbi:unnamed protein product [Colias eurytheme]|nr:unnamed protein product [Colias eurytheme]